MSLDSARPTERVPTAAGTRGGGANLARVGAAAKRTTKSFSEALPAILRERGISYRQFAASLEVTQSYLSRSLNGERSPSKRLLESAARQLGLPKDYFPEYRALVIAEAVERDGRLRDRIYDSLRRR